MVNETAKDEFFKPIKPLLERFEVFGSPDYTVPRVFVVRERERIYWKYPSYGYDGVAFWLNDGSKEFDNEEEIRTYLDTQNADEDIFFDKNYYRNVEIVKKLFFTKQAAEEYLLNLPKKDQTNLFISEEPAQHFGHEVVAICAMLNQLKKELQQ